MRRVLSSCSLSLEAVKHGHTISAVGVEPCTGRLYFSGGGSVTSFTERRHGNQRVQLRRYVVVDTSIAPQFWQLNAFVVPSLLWCVFVCCDSSSFDSSFVFPPSLLSFFFAWTLYSWTVCWTFRRRSRIL